MKCAIAGGGTGGHIYPGIAVAEEIVRRGGEAFFLGTSDGMESRIVPRSGFRFRAVAAAPIKRGRWLQNISSLVRNLRGVGAARAVLAEEKPAVVLGTGGYVSFTAAAAALTRGIPLAIHEQNAVPGLANRVLARRADAVMTAWEGVRTGGRVEVVGLPVRADFAWMTRAEARARLGFAPDARVLLAFGGSRGAAAINAAMASSARRFEGIELLWAAGTDHFDRVKAALGALPPRVRILPYIDDMPSALHAADLVVCRAGAMTLAELAACGKPAVLAPYPHATADHQTANASSFVRAGAAVMIRDAELEQRMYAVAMEILSDDARRAAMADRAQALARPDAAGRIADILEELARA